MKSREDFEDEMDLKYEMEMVRKKEEEMAKEKEDFDGKVGTSAVEKLMENFDSEALDEDIDSFLKEDKDALNMYERDTEYFERDMEDDLGEEKVSFYRDEDNSDEETVDDDVKYDPKKVRTYFNAVVATLILFLLVVVFLLIMKLSSYEDKNIANQENITTEQTEDKENIKRLQDENTTLNKEVTGLRNEIQNLMVESGAEVDENNAESQNVAEPVAPIETIPEPEVPLAPPPAPVDDGVLKADVVHTVKKGDTLTKLARIYYGDQSLYTKIKEANGLTGDEIVLGTDLIIPKQY